MSVELLGTVALALAAFLVAHVWLRRSAPATDGDLRLLTARPEREPAGGSREHAPLADPCAWVSVVVSDLSAAEELLDRAEADGYRQRELVVMGTAAFLVRWRDRA
jgi:hypothetical protein